MPSRRDTAAAVGRVVLLVGQCGMLWDAQPGVGVFARMPALEDQAGRGIRALSRKERVVKSALG